eukprot:CAMPEP_0177717288 /NCGR_PEP_ID=MMETSP0484_2-20121128/14954_1 /TAXON_ID=354590 /ORGANISM="Rhodomonas lens, Strain RHODO" /LENGTH=123 /DNA_ID=CAMNT_0019229357 /DNA_START=67 /DNA_END=438 /DNA_ORIENTATION=-
MCAVALLGLATLSTTHLSTELVGVPVVYKSQQQTAAPHKISSKKGSALSSSLQFHQNGAPIYPELGANGKHCDLRKLWDNCKATQCCDNELVCYQQNEFYAQCMRPGQCSKEGGIWSCDVLHP